MVKLLDYAAQDEVLEKAANPFAKVVQAHLKTLQTRQDPEGRRVWKLRVVRSLYERGSAACPFRSEPSAKYSPSSVSP